MCVPSWQGRLLHIKVPLHLRHGRQIIPLCLYALAGSPCSLATKLIPPAKPQPNIHLLPSSGAVYVQYGKPAPLDVRPCSSGSQDSNCGAVAWEQLATQGRQDLTHYITVTQTAQCDSPDSQVLNHQQLVTWLLAHLVTALPLAVLADSSSPRCNYSYLNIVTPHLQP